MAPDGLATLVGDEGRLGDVDGREVEFGLVAPLEGRVAGLVVGPPVEGLDGDVDGFDGEDVGRRSLADGLAAPLGLLDAEVDGVLAVDGLDVLGFEDDGFEDLVLGFDEDGLDEDGLDEDGFDEVLRALDEDLELEDFDEEDFEEEDFGVDFLVGFFSWRFSSASSTTGGLATAVSAGAPASKARAASEVSA